MDASLEPGRRVGEIIETSSVRLWGECDRLNEMPPLGSVVCAGTPSGDVVFAVVALGQTSSVDATRRAVRRGSDELRDEDVYRHHPELRQILRTTFESIPVAYERGGRFQRTLPPQLPPLHYAVDWPEPGALRALTDDPSYLTHLAAYHGEVPAEQLLVAHLRAIYAARGDDELWLYRAAQEVARLFKQDYDRLLPILEAVDPLL